MPFRSLIAALFLLLLAGPVWGQCDTWHAGPPLEFPGIDGQVYAATTWDPDGSGPAGPQLVVGGFFRSAGGVAANGIARWDGTTWQPFATGVAGGFPAVRALAVLPSSFGALANQIIVGGQFRTAGGVTVNGLARWTGSSWQTVPGWTNPSNNVYALAIALRGRAGHRRRGLRVDGPQRCLLALERHYGHSHFRPARRVW